ncbi:hypothetical protein JCM10207_004389 [Rhodosporidiobolus poonsookiae]
MSSTKTPRARSLPASTVAPGESAIPVARINRIIKADKDVRVCSKEAVFLIAKATELMLGKLTTQAYHNARMDRRQKMVRYSDLAAAVHAHPAWFYLGEVIPSSLPLSAALELRQANDDLADAPAAVTTAAPTGGEGAAFTGKRVVKGKGRKSAPLPPSGEEGGEEVEMTAADGATSRKTRGKKIVLPAGEGGPDEDEDEFEDDGAEGDDGDEGSEFEDDGAGAGGKGRRMQLD